MYARFLIMITGLAMLGAGCWMVYPPLALITVGLIIVLDVMLPRWQPLQSPVAAQDSAP